VIKPGTTSARQRIEEIRSLLEREAAGLQRTRKRLFEGGEIDRAWVESIAEHQEREDLAESFAAKFNRFQDTIGDKLLPRILDWVAEPVGPFIDNLDRAERLGWLRSADRWVQARRLRNRLVHEYVDDPAEFAAALNLANGFVDELMETRRNLERVYLEHA
jgi:hypothetical protein